MRLFPLGEQAADAFTDTRMENLQAFADAFGIKKIDSQTPDTQLAKVSAKETFRIEPGGFKVGRGRFISVPHKVPGTGIAH